MREQRAPWARLLASAGVLTGCSGEPVTRALEEPIRVEGAQFRTGTLPGLPALSADQVNAGARPQEPVVISTAVGNSWIPAGEPSRNIKGLASADSAAIGARFADLGTGYWLLPTGAADTVNDGALEWGFRAAFGRDAPPGLHQLQLAAFDATGRAGQQVELTLCLAAEIPDNGNACTPEQAPPDTVVSLGWDAPVDLDLRVITPDGKLVDSKRPTSAPADPEGNADPDAEGTGVIAYDSYANCAADGRRREHLVFQTRPPSGVYLVYVNLYDACGEAGVHFEVSLQHARAGAEPDTFRTEQSLKQAGQLQAVHANGGAALGLFVTSFVVD